MEVGKSDTSRLTSAAVRVAGIRPSEAGLVNTSRPADAKPVKGCLSPKKGALGRLNGEVYSLEHPPEARHNQMQVRNGDDVA